MEELLKAILAAQVTQIALLQAIAVSVGAQVRREYGANEMGTVNWEEALKALEAGEFHLAARRP